MKNNFKKRGYKINPIGITGESEGEKYWNRSRFNSSKLFQYAVYRDACDIIEEFNIKSIADVGCVTGEKLKRGYPRSLLLCLEPTHRTALENYDDRNP